MPVSPVQFGNLFNLNEILVNEGYAKAMDEYDDFNLAKISVT